MDVDVQQAEANNNVQEQLHNLKSQNIQLLQQISQNGQELSSLQAALRGSTAHIKNLEARAEDLERRREDAVSTLFRLRPQRQDCTETEIKEDYDLLKSSIEKWVDTNCEAFLDNEQLGFDKIWGNLPGDRGQLKGHEAILQNIRSQPDRWSDAKDQVLIFVIMHYISDNILRPSFPAWLPGDGLSLLQLIQQNLENLEPKRGKLQVLFQEITADDSVIFIDIHTRRNWRSDTIACLFSSPELEDVRAKHRKKLVEDLLHLVQRTLPTPLIGISTSDFKKSLLSEVIEPSLSLAQKVGHAKISIKWGSHCS